MNLTEQIYGFRYPYAIVGFGGRPLHWWTFFLKKDFYHCVLALGDGFNWIVIDPLLHYTDLLILKGVDIGACFKEKGYKILWVKPVIPPLKKRFLRPSTCVETVCRFLGIQHPFIWTPYQLYHFLLKKGK